MTRGTTLIETIILTGMTLLMFLALVQLYLIFNSIYGYQRAFSMTAGSAGASLNALQAAVLPADAVLASHAFSLGGTYASATTTLVLALPSVNASGDIVLGAKDYVVFYVSSSTLYRFVEADAQSVRNTGSTTLSTTLSSLSFTYDNADFTKVTTVTADIQTQKLFKQETLQSHLYETWRLRNAP